MKVAEANEKFEVEAVKHEICEIKRSRAQKNCNELRASKQKCYEISLECAKKLKDNFCRVGAFSSEQKFICGDTDGVVCNTPGVTMAMAPLCTNDCDHMWKKLEKKSKKP
jgi:hypothetical protein